jgi:glycine cleavage system H protein
MIPPDLRYHREHDWVRVEEDGQTAVFGITDYAQEQLGDIVYVTLPKVGDRTRQNEPFGGIDSVKTFADLIAPLSGEVIAVNEALRDHPERINEDPYEAGWLVRIRPADLAELDNLLTAEEYAALIAA